MDHVKKEALIELADLMVYGSEIPGIYEKSMHHIKGCEACKDSLLRIITVGEMLTPEAVYDFFRNEAEIERHETEAALEKKEAAIIEIKPVFDAALKRFRLSIEKMADSMFSFIQNEEFAYARGESSVVDSYFCGESLITFESDSGEIEISLDKDVLNDKKVVAVLKGREKTVEYELKDNGHGMVTALLKIDESVSIEIKIL